MRIDTERLVLRPWVEQDIEAFAAINADAEVMRHFPSTLTRDETWQGMQRHLEHFANHGFSWLAIERKACGSCIGLAGLAYVPADVPIGTPAHPAVETGWRLARAHWRRGYALEAAQASVRYGFDVLKLDRIVAYATYNNQASIGVMRRLGMTDTGQSFDHPRFGADSPLNPMVVYDIHPVRDDG